MLCIYLLNNYIILYVYGKVDNHACSKMSEWYTLVEYWVICVEECGLLYNSIFFFIIFWDHVL